MVASRENAEQGLGFILTDISRLARKEFDRRIRDLGLTRAQWLVLHHLARLPGCTQSDLAERLQMEKITVSRHADRLVRAGWIARRDCSVDGRAYRLFVAPKAEPIIARLAAVAAEMRGEYLAGLAPARRRALFTDLEHIRSNLLRMDADAKRRPS
jgi:MarR family transcriptional regulator, transcriptional regulator for hemolysin